MESLTVRKTRAGWNVEYTARKGEYCLEVGGICGRVVLYKKATLERIGLNYDADPLGHSLGAHVSDIFVLGAETPDRVLKAGTRIV